MKKQITILSIYVFVFFIGAAFLVLPLRLLIKDNDLLFSSLANFFVYVVMLLCCFFLFKRELKTDFLSFKKEKNIIGEIVMGYLLLIGAGIVGVMVVGLLGYENRDSINQESIEAVMKSKYMIFAALSVLMAPLVEEIVFRKAMFDLFCVKWKFSPWIILVLSSVLFGLIHVIGNIDGDITELVLVIPYVTRGVALGYVYLRNDRNIMAPIAVHFLNNFISIFAIFAI